MADRRPSRPTVETTRRPVRRRPEGLPQPSASAIAATRPAGPGPAMDAIGGTATVPPPPDPAATAARAASTSAVPVAAPMHGSPGDASAAALDRADLLLRAGGTLLELLDRQRGVHDRLLEHLERKRDAIRRADVADVTACCDAERTLLGEIESLEGRRRDVVSGLTGVVAPGRSEPLPLTELAPHLPDPLSDRLLEVRGSLRSSVEEAARLSAVVAGAADAIGRHLAGLVQTVGTAIAGPGTYGRRGRVDAPSSPSIRLDLTS